MFIVQQSFMGTGSVNWFQLAVVVGLLIDDDFPSLPGLVHCDLCLGNLPPKPFHSVPFSQSGSFLDGRLRYSRGHWGVSPGCSMPLLSWDSPWVRDHLDLVCHICMCLQCLDQDEFVYRITR